MKNKVITFLLTTACSSAIIMPLHASDQLTSDRLTSDRPSYKQELPREHQEQKIQAPELYLKTIQNLRETIEVLNFPPYARVIIGGGIIIDPDYNEILQEFFNDSYLQQIFGEEIPDHIQWFADSHKKYHRLLGMDALTDKGESITTDSYPNPSISLEKAREDKDRANNIYHQITQLDPSDSESNSQKQKYYKEFFDSAMEGNQTAQHYITFCDRLIRDIELRRSKYLSDGQRLLFKALNHFLVYSVAD